MTFSMLIVKSFIKGTTTFHAESISTFHCTRNRKRLEIRSFLLCIQGMHKEPIVITCICSRTSLINQRFHMIYLANITHGVRRLNFELEETSSDKEMICPFCDKGGLVLSFSHSRSCSCSFFTFTLNRSGSSDNYFMCEMVLYQPL